MKHIQVFNRFLNELDKAIEEFKTRHKKSVGVKISYDYQNWFTDDQLAIMDVKLHMFDKEADKYINLSEYEIRKYNYYDILHVLEGLL